MVFTKPFSLNVLPASVFKVFTGLRHIKLEFIDLVNKTNKAQRVQQRLVAATSTHLYSCLPDNGDIQRCVERKKVNALAVSRGRFEVLLVISVEYDMMFACSSSVALDDFINLFPDVVPSFHKEPLIQLPNSSSFRLEKPEKFVRTNPSVFVREFPKVSCVEGGSPLVSAGRSFQDHSGTLMVPVSGSEYPQNDDQDQSDDDDGPSSANLIASNRSLLDGADGKRTNGPVLRALPLTRAQQPASSTMSPIKRTLPVTIHSVINAPDTETFATSPSTNASPIFQEVKIPSSKSQSSSAVPTAAVQQNSYRSISNLLSAERECNGALRRIVDELRGEVDRLTFENLLLKRRSYEV